MNNVNEYGKEEFEENPLKYKKKRKYKQMGEEERRKRTIIIICHDFL